MNRVYKNWFARKFCDEWSIHRWCMSTNAHSNALASCQVLILGTKTLNALCIKKAAGTIPIYTNSADNNWTNSKVYWYPRVALWIQHPAFSCRCSSSVERANNKQRNGVWSIVRCHRNPVRRKIRSHSHMDFGHYWWHRLVLIFSLVRFWKTPPNSLLNFLN
jgi:hypothetical protein